MKCCGHETEDESDRTRNDDIKKVHEKGRHSDDLGHPGQPGHAGCCGGGGSGSGGGGILKWVFAGLIISLVVLFIRGMM